MCSHSLRAEHCTRRVNSSQAGYSPDTSLILPQHAIWKISKESTLVCMCGFVCPFPPPLMLVKTISVCSDSSEFPHVPRRAKKRWEGTTEFGMEEEKQRGVNGFCIVLKAKRRKVSSIFINLMKNDGWMKLGWTYNIVQSLILLLQCHVPMSWPVLVLVVYFCWNSSADSYHDRISW